MKRKRILLVLFTLALAASLFYVVYYQLKLKDIAGLRYDLTYYVAYSLDAVPVLYCSFGTVAGMLVQFWAEKPIARRMRILSAVIGGGLVLIYFATRIAYWFYFTGVVPYYPFPARLSMLLMAHPILFLILGLILSVGITKDGELTEPLRAKTDPDGISVQLRELQ